jgi:hypothetical protein
MLELVLVALIASSDLDARAAIVMAQAKPVARQYTPCDVPNCPCECAATGICMCGKPDKDGWRWDAVRQVYWRWASEVPIVSAMPVTSQPAPTLPQMSSPMHLPIYRPVRFTPQPMVCIGGA